MKLHIIAPPDSTDAVEVTSTDAKLVDASIDITIVHVEKDPYSQIKQLSTLELIAGDVICLAGTCLRQTVAAIAEIAINSKLNFMPGSGVDHRGVPIEPHKINFRSPMEKNNIKTWPYIMVIGNPELAKKSFEIFQDLDSKLYWPNYIPDPEIVRVEHLLAVISVTGLWEVPPWFKIVDMSVRDLEIAPVMYSSHMWHDWIAFYPANGNFKLENHTQLYPVWLAGSTKPLEYWKP
jgi:hypothetical protein